MRWIKTIAKVVLYIGLLCVLAFLILCLIFVPAARGSTGDKVFAFLIFLLPAVIVTFAMNAILRFSRLGRAMLVPAIEPPVGIAKGLVGIARGIPRLRSQWLAARRPMSETEKRLKPYALMGFIITTGSALAFFAIFVVFLVLFLRRVQVSLGGVVFFLVFYTLVIGMYWKVGSWFNKKMHVGEVWKDGRWQPRPRRDGRLLPRRNPAKSDDNPDTEGNPR